MIQYLVKPTDTTYRLLRKTANTTLGLYFTECETDAAYVGPPIYADLHIVYWDREEDCPADLILLQQIPLMDGLYLARGIDDELDDIVFSENDFPVFAHPGRHPPPFMGAHGRIHEIVITCDATPALQQKYAEYERMKFEAEAFDKFVKEFEVFKEKPIGHVVTIIGGTGRKRELIGIKGRVIACIQAMYHDGTRPKLGITQNNVIGKVMTGGGHEIEGYPDTIWVWQHNCQPTNIIGRDENTFAANALKIGLFAKEQAETFTAENEDRIVRIGFRHVFDEMMGMGYLLANTILEKKRISADGKQTNDHMVG